METKETLEMRDEEAVRAAAPRAMRSMSPMAMLGRRHHRLRAPGYAER